MWNVWNKCLHDHVYIKRDQINNKNWNNSVQPTRMSLSLKYTILLADGLFIFKGKTEDVGIAKISGSYLEANISKCRASCFAVQLPMSVGGQGKKKFGKAQFLCLPDYIPCWSDGQIRNQVASF